MKINMKQTLEEAAQSMAYNKMPDWGGLPALAKKYFIKGAEWQSKQSPWISVKDRLPRTYDDLYIVLDVRMNPPGCGVCDFNPKTETWIDYGGNIVRPTHWMPIPPLESKGKYL